MQDTLRRRMALCRYTITIKARHRSILHRIMGRRKECRLTCLMPVHMDAILIEDTRTAMVEIRIEAGAMVVEAENVRLPGADVRVLQDQGAAVVVEAAVGRRLEVAAVDHQETTLLVIDDAKITIIWTEKVHG